MSDSERVLDELHLQIIAALDMYPSESWSVAACRRVRDLLTELAVAALQAEVEEVRR